MSGANDFQIKRIAGVLLAGTAMTTLAACSSGGGGGGSGGGSTTNAGQGDPSFFQTAEFQNSDALQQIDADQGYARVAGNVGGRGVRVAVIDDGIDRDHFDLDDNIDRDLGFTGQTEIDNFIDISGLGKDGHGTAVAGVIAAERNGTGIHGVAFDADLVSIDVFSEDTNPNNGSDVTRNIASAVRSASSGRGESDIINLSLAVFPDGSQQQDDLILDIEDAMRDAAGEGKILVVAAGNDGGANPTLPARFVDNSGIAGLGIAVGSVDANDTISGFSNRCGDTANFCMVAPGERVDTTLPGDQFGQVTGTSFAAPLVAGSAAVVKAAFPGIGNRDVVDRLLSTAKDLGPAGTDAVYGRGRLDLNAALAPVGQLSVSLSNSVDGASAPATSSQMSFDSSFSLGGASALLERAVVFDQQGFPFVADLNGNVDHRSRTTGIESFVSADRSMTSVTTTEMGSVAFSLSEQPESTDPHRQEFQASDTSLREEAEDPRISFRSDVSDGIGVFVSLNGGSTTQLGLDQALASEDAAIFEQQTFLAPYERLAGLQSGGGAVYELDEDTKIGISSFVAADSDALTQMNMQKVELMHRTVGDIELRLGYGLLQEEGGIIGSAASGAFGAQTATDTQFANISLTAPITEDVSLFGAYSRGRSSTSTANGSVLSDFSNTVSEAFGAGLVVDDIFDDDDGLTLMVGQPLRVTSGAADVTVSVGRTEDGKVLKETVRADLSPDEREIATEMVYRTSLGEDGHDLTAGAFARFNPDHDPDAAPDFGIGLNYRLSF